MIFFYSFILLFSFLYSISFITIYNPMFYLIFCIIVLKIITMFHDGLICLIKIMYFLCSNQPLIQCGLASVLLRWWQCLWMSVNENLLMCCNNHECKWLVFVLASVWGIIRRQSLGKNCAESVMILCDTCHSGMLFTFYLKLVPKNPV